MADNKENKAVQETTNKKPEKKIQFFNEKKWIMAYWFKTIGRKKAQYTEKYLLAQWSRWWEGDFDSVSDERLHDILVWLKETVRPMTKDEVKKKRHDIAYKKRMTPYFEKLGAKKGYYVKKCSTRHHPLKVSGYAIFKNKTDKVPVYGKNFDLTAHQVKKILESKEDKQNGF